MTTALAREPHASTQQPTPAAAVIGLSKTYPSGTIALRDLTLSVEEGEVFGLLGPNGAGKSTTVGILTTMVRPTGGVAYIDGIDVRRDPRRVRSRIGVVFQDSVLDNEFTVTENLLLHARLRGMEREASVLRITSLLDQLGMSDRADHGVRTLSGGLRRRVEIARGLLAHPRILFLDEPTVGLDPAVRAEIWRLVAELRDREGVTVVLTTHYLEEAESVCDRVAVLHRGRLVAVDRPRNLIDQLGELVIELHTRGDAGGLVEELTLAHLTDRPPLLVPGFVSLTSRRSRDDLAAAVALMQSAHPEVTATTIRPTTLSDVYHHLTGASTADDGKAKQ